MPPSSSVSRFPDPAVAARIRRPTAVDPVKAILSIPSCVTIISPTAPSPVTTFRTPFGTPASRASDANRSAVSEVYSAGFSTTVFPMASAGATFQASIKSGKFHGMICPQTPTASRSGSSASMSCAIPAWK